MTRTSSDRRRSTRQMARFQRSFWAVVATFALIATGALAGYALQGPRLREASIDVVRAISQPQTLLRLTADRPLDPSAEVTVEVSPDTPHQVVVDGSALAIVFDRALRYDTDYQVTVSGVQQEGNPAQAVWRHEFRTPVANMWFLDRGEGSDPDRILRVTPGAEEPQVIYQAEGINLFTPIGSVVVVATQDGRRQAGLGLVEPISGRQETIVLPAKTEIVDLFSPASGTRVYFTLRSTGGASEYDRTLFVLDTAGSRTPTPITDLTGNPIRATKAFSVPGSDKLVVWVDDIAVVQVDPTAGLVLPVMTEAQELWGVSTNGREVVAVDLAGTVAINIDDLSERRLSVGPIGPRDVYEGDTVATGSGFTVSKVAVPNASDTEFTSVLVRVAEDGEPTILYRTPQDLGSIGRFQVSPNDQYVAAEVVPNLSTQLLDGRILAPRDQAVTTVVIDLDTGLIVRTVEGFWPVW